MGVARVAALTTIIGGLTVAAAVLLLAGWEWGLLTVGVLLLAAGISSLRSPNG